MLKRRKFLKISAGTSAALVAAACAPVAAPSATAAPASPGATAAPAAATPRRGGTFVGALTNDPTGGNSIVAGNANSIYSLSMTVHSSLLYIDANRKLQPELAESWTISPDEKTYTFKLRANAKWHDGKPVTSADVKYTIEEVAAKYSGLFRGNASNLARVDTPDAQTVVFVLTQPVAVFLLLFTPNTTTILPKHIYEGSDPRSHANNQAPVGSGPYKFQEWVKGDHITLVRNENYYLPNLPYFDRVVFRIMPDAGSRVIAFQRGEVDWLPNAFYASAQAKQIAALPGVYADSRGTPGQYIMFANTTKKPLDDVRVRRAIAQAIDPKAMIEKALFGFGGQPPINHLEPALVPYHNPSAKLPAFDVAAANKLLDESGNPKGADGRRFGLRIAFDPSFHKNQAEIVNDSLAAVGIKGELTPYDVATYSKVVYTDANFDLFISQFGSNDDPALSLGNRYNSANIGTTHGNGARYKNSEVDQLLAEGAATTNVDKRKAAYGKVQEILVRDLPVIPLIDYFAVDFYAKGIKGYETTPLMRPFYRIQNIWRGD